MIKLNPNATAVEQPWDVSVCYKFLYAWSKLSRKGVSQPAETIKARVKEALGDPTIRGKFVVGADMQDALIDLCGKLPQMQHLRQFATQVCSRLSPRSISAYPCCIHGMRHHFC